MKTLWFLTLSILLLFGCSSNEMDEQAVLSAPESIDPSSPQYNASGFADANGSAYELSQQGNEGAKSIAVPDGNGNATIVPSASTAPVKTPDKIIKSGNMSMEVEEYQKAMQQIADMVKAAQGYISNQNEQRTDYRITNTLTMRMPSQNFDALMTGISDVAKKVIFKNVNMHDVTEEYTDVAARLKTKREVELRYLEILKSAKTIKDILEVEEQLRVIREEIESATARLKYMDDRVSYSTISLEVYQEIAYNAPAPLQTGFGHKLLDSLISGWNGLLALVIGLVRIWPMMLIITVVLVLLYRKWKGAPAR